MDASTPSPSAAPSIRERDYGGLVAAAVSYLVNPLVLPPLVYGLVLGHVGAPAADVATGVGLAVVFLALVPLAHVGWLRWRGVIASLEIRDRRRRTRPFLGVLGAGLGALAVAGSLSLTGHALLMALLGCHVINTALLFLITTRWKISVHCAAAAGALATLLFVRLHVPGTLLNTLSVGGLVLGTGALLVPLLLWARVRSRAHTWAQAAAGTGLGLVAPYAELSLLGVGAGL